MDKQTILADWAMESANAIAEKLGSENLSLRSTTSYCNAIILLLGVFIESWMNLIQYWFAKSAVTDEEKREIMGSSIFYRNLSKLTDNKWAGRCVEYNSGKDNVLYEFWIKMIQGLDVSGLSEEEVLELWDKEWKLYCKSTVLPEVKKGWEDYCNHEVNPKFKEIFVLRDICAHNHGWFYEMDEQRKFNNPILVNDEIGAEKYGDSKYRDVINEKEKKTKVLHLNIIPGNMNINDIATIMEEINKIREKMSEYNIRSSFYHFMIFHEFDMLYEEINELKRNK